ncbi:DEDDh family exonuclease [Mycobacterium koreense]|uniref:DNA polymerase III subunit epsilon n=1 Tax=Mycolicibacillus koreensis TaxID=1069220 RepID=A0AA91SQN1_9MYCO|nr:DEDDh family exonuclease [Mycolicibacillus koreensis]MCV7247103.1 DEDDh family exonuclease [Mycolicibacillus koreensis]OSC31876.1 DNA polymerase III subunit epsilon [Mycolicibacillus koreensis]
MAAVTGWGRPPSESAAGWPGWAVLDVETSGFRPDRARVLSIAVLALDVDGQVERSVVSLLNPGVDPGPTHVHGLTAEMLAGAPRFSDIVGEVAEVLHGRTLVAHNAAFDYAFVTAEAELVGAALPVDTVMCTVDLARRLDLGLDNLRLETLAAHLQVPQSKAHDALDDALVLSRVLDPMLRRARERDVWLPVRPVSRQRWPNGHVTHAALEPLKKWAARQPGPFVNPGRYVPGRPLVQGMRVALAPECTRRHDELVERLLHAGLAYSDAVDAQTSLVLCNDPRPAQGKGFTAVESGVPLLGDAEFLAALSAVRPGVAVEEFIDTTPAAVQGALF